MRGKLFFYANYEGFRQSTQTTQNFTIPARADLLTGNFRYVATDGSVREANILQLTGQTVDAKMQSDILSRYPGPDKVNSYDSGDSRADRILNTGRYRFQQDDLNDRNQWLGRADYELNSKNRFEFVYSYIKETDDRTDLDHVTLPRPLVFTESTGKRFVGAWRWAPTSRLQNELRIGGNLAPVAFESEVDFSSAYLFNVPAIAGLSTPLPANGNTAVAQIAADLPAAGPRHQDLPGDRQRLLRRRRPSAPVRRQPADDQGQPVQLRRPVSRR